MHYPVWRLAREMVARSSRAHFALPLSGHITGRGGEKPDGPRIDVVVVADDAGSGVSAGVGAAAGNVGRVVAKAALGPILAVSQEEEFALPKDGGPRRLDCLARWHAAFRGRILLAGLSQFRDEGRDGQLPEQGQGLDEGKVVGEVAHAAREHAPTSGTLVGVLSITLFDLEKASCAKSVPAPGDRYRNVSTSRVCVPLQAQLAHKLLARRHSDGGGIDSFTLPSETSIHSF